MNLTLGLVCKGGHSKYIPACDRFWFKLKRDYIEGLGDTGDFAIIGGRYNHRNTFLKISTIEYPYLFNEFFVGCQLNRDNPHGKPNFAIVFTVSAGFKRDDLINIADKLIHPRVDISKLSEYNVENKKYYSSIWYFQRPLVAELKGGGFIYQNWGACALRSPRVVRLRPDLSYLTDAVTYSELADMMANSQITNLSSDIVKLKSADHVFISNAKSTEPRTKKQKIETLNEYNDKTNQELEIDPLSQSCIDNAMEGGVLRLTSTVYGDFSLQIEPFDEDYVHRIPNSFVFIDKKTFVDTTVKDIKSRICNRLTIPPGIILESVDAVFTKSGWISCSSSFSPNIMGIIVIGQRGSLSEYISFISKYIRYVYAEWDFTRILICFSVLFFPTSK